MKSPLLLPLYLVSLVTLFLLGFTLLAMASAWVAASEGGLGEAAREVLARSPWFVESCLPAALFPAVLFTGVRIARNPVSRPFSLLLPLATVFCVLYFGPMGLRLLGSPGASDAASPARGGAYIRAGVLASSGGSGAQRRVLLAARVTPTDAGVDLEDVVVLGPSPAESRLQYFQRGDARVEAAGPVLRLEETSVPGQGGSVVTVPLLGRPILMELVEPAESTSALIRDFGSLGLELRAASSASELLSVGTCLGLAAFLCFSTFIVRLTRWPLLGFALLVLLWRGALVGIRFTAEVVRPALSGLLPASDVGAALVQGAPGLLLLAAGILCLVVDVLLVPFDFWKREIEA